MCKERSKAKPPLASARAVVLALALAVVSATVGGCAGTSGDYWRERPASANYQRLPIR
jgi:hypothetical protein